MAENNNHILDSTSSYIMEVNNYGEAATIDPVRRSILDGNVFDFSYYATSIANEGYVDLYIAKDITKGKLFKAKYISVQCEGAITITYYKNPTVSAEGTEITPYNLNSLSSTTFPVAIKHTPTVTSAGTQVAPEFRVVVPTTAGVSTTAVGQRGDEYSRIFSTDNSYLGRIQNVSGAEISELEMYGRVVILGDV